MTQMLLLAVLMIVAASNARLPQNKITGYATGIYHNNKDWNSRIVIGQEFQCELRDALRDATLSDANECAMDWCQQWADQNTNPTSECKAETVAQARANSEITRVAGSPIIYYRKRR